MSQSLTGKTALVTGASRGLGKASALALAAQGATVVVAGRTEEPKERLPGTIHQTVQEILSRGGKALAVKADLAVPAEVDALVQRVLAEFGGADIVLHNAAAVTRDRLLEIPMRRWDLIWNVNTRSAVALMAGFYPAMKRRGGGHVIIVTQQSDPTQSARGFSPAYGMAKNIAADIVVIGAEEGRADGIALNALWPAGPRDTFGGRTARGWDQPRGLHANIFADAVVELATRDPRKATGRFLTDEQALREAGMSDFSKYEPTTSQPEF